MTLMTNTFIVRWPRKGFCKSIFYERKIVWGTPPGIKAQIFSLRSNTISWGKPIL